MPREALYTVIVEESGEVLADKVLIAQTLYSRSRGLLGRDSLDPGEGLLIKPCGSIHTFFMKIPIDALFLDKNMKILKVAKNLTPWRLCGCLFGCHSVLEISSGASGKSGNLTKRHVKLVKNNVQL